MVFFFAKYFMFCVCFGVASPYKLYQILGGPHRDSETFLFRSIRFSNVHAKILTSKLIKYRADWIIAYSLNVRSKWNLLVLHESFVYFMPRNRRYFCSAINRIDYCLAFARISASARCGNNKKEKIIKDPMLVL